MENVKESLIGSVSGFIGAWASVLVGQPLDTLKVKMQTFPMLYPNAWTCFKVTLRTEGITKGLYRGTAPSLLASGAENTALFCALPANQKVLSWILDKNVSDFTTLEHGITGTASAFWSSLVLCPSELVKCKMQSHRELKLSKNLKIEKISPFSVTREIYKEEGLWGFMRGIRPTWMREMPGYFFFFGGYELSRTLLTREGQSKDDLPVIYTALSGGVGGVSLWVAVFPFDVIKSRIQVLNSGKGGNNQPATVFGTMKNIIKYEGVRKLYRGLGPTVCRTFPATGCLFVTVEWSKNHLTRIFEQKKQT